MARRSPRPLAPSAVDRFVLLAWPGAVFVVVFLLLPILSILVFSFWRTESYSSTRTGTWRTTAVLITEPTY